MRGNGTLPLLFLLMPLWIPALFVVMALDELGYKKPFAWINRNLSKIDL